MPQLVECVPNFSDGRNPHVYNTIADTIRSVSGVQVLDVSADADHNRTVITFVGEPEAVSEAAFRAIAEAAKHINLNHHQGEHPRIGATDVCPLIPLRDITQKECVALANRLAQRVGDELGIAVYLYGAAATRPEREKLATIRKGEYELWKEEVATNPDRQPDFGPAEAHTWGATVIGVRPFLIAYNLYLNTSDIAIAEKIARAVRFSSGGLRFVQAKGFLVDGQAQVSMNLTDFHKTPIHQVQEMVKREAAQYGATVTSAELVGLIPQQALMSAAKWYLQLDRMHDNHILEYRLTQISANEETPEPTLDDTIPTDYLALTAAPTPTPGGGSAAALAAALGAALAEMVAGLTVNRKKYANVQAEAQTILRDAAQLRKELTQAIAEDAAAYEAVMAAYRNKEMDEAEKATAVANATTHAGEVPLRVAQLARDVAQLARWIAEIGNLNAATDAASAALLARAAVQIAALNVRVNATTLEDTELTQSWRTAVTDLVTITENLVTETVAIAAKRGGF